MKPKHFTSKNKDKRGKKDWRTSYSDMSRDKRVMAFDRSCRHGGSCAWCAEQRRFRQKRQEANTKDQLDD